MPRESLARKLLYQQDAARWSSSEFKLAKAQILSFGKRDLNLAVIALRSLYKKASKEFQLYWGCPHVQGNLYPPGHTLERFENKELAMAIAARCHGLYATSELLKEHYLVKPD